MLFLLWGTVGADFFFGGVRMNPGEQEGWNTIKRIISGGETAEVRMTKDGIKVYEQSRKLMFGKSTLKK